VLLQTIIGNTEQVSENIEKKWKDFLVLLQFLHDM